MHNNLCDLHFLMHSLWREWSLLKWLGLNRKEQNPFVQRSFYGDLKWKGVGMAEGEPKTPVESKGQCVVSESLPSQSGHTVHSHTAARVLTELALQQTQPVLHYLSRGWSAIIKGPVLQRKCVQLRVGLRPMTLPFGVLASVHFVPGLNKSIKPSYSRL